MFIRWFFVSLLSFSFGDALQAMEILVFSAAETQEKQTITHSCVCSLDAAQKAMEGGHMKPGERFEFVTTEQGTRVLVRGMVCWAGGQLHFDSTRLSELTRVGATPDDTEPEN